MISSASRAAGLRGFGPLAVVLGVGVVARAVLIPITHGPDFTVWDLASRATLNGVNVYAHHPAYSGGPFPYFPLFLYIELPMQWLAIHTGVSFTILGKLPIVGADLLATVLIVRELRLRGAGQRTQAVAAALFFLNPLVLYNGAFYGRFDSVCVALLMVAFAASARRPLSWRFSIAYALSIAAKTFPVFLLPWLLRRGRVGAVRVLACVVAVLFAVAAPYVVTSPRAFLTDLLYSADKLPGALSWQVALHGLPAATQVDVGNVLLGVFVLAAVAVAFYVDDFTVAAAATMVLFLLFSKQVIEQYLIWPMPFLVLLATGRGSRAAWWLIAELTAAGMVVNAYFHPFGLQPTMINLVFAAAVGATLARMLATERANRTGWPARDTAPVAPVRSTLAVGSGR